MRAVMDEAKCQTFAEDWISVNGVIFLTVISVSPSYTLNSGVVLSICRYGNKEKSSSSICWKRRAHTGITPDRYFQRAGIECTKLI